MKMPSLKVEHDFTESVIPEVDLDERLGFYPVEEGRE